MLLIGGHPDGRIEVALRGLENGEAGFIDGVISPPIEELDHSFAILHVEWRDRRIEGVRINGTHVFPNCEVELLVLEGILSDPETTSLSERSEQARKDRHAKLQNLSLKPHRRDGGEDYLLSALVGEKEQIEDLLDAVRRGREAHVAGLAARVRVLTDDKPFGLLQYCASFRQLPLTTYTNRFPESTCPLNEGLVIMGSVSGELSTYCCIPVDLDVWLRFPALQLGDKLYSHRDVIKAFGDTIGAHRDRGITEELQAYQAIRSQAGRRYGDVQKYVVEVSKATLALANFVISESTNNSGTAKPQP